MLWLDRFNEMSQRARFLFMCGLVFMLVEVLMLTYYRQWTMSWWGVPVVLIAPIGIMPGLLAFRFFGMFDTYEPSPSWVLNTIFVFTLLTTCVGSWVMEPAPEQDLAPAQTYQSPYAQRYYHSRGYRFYGHIMGRTINDMWSGQEAAAGSTVKVNSSNKLWKVVLLLTVLLAYILGAFFIPGFWIVSSMLGWVTLFLLWRKEYKRS